MAKLTKQSSHYYRSRTERNNRALSWNKTNPRPEAELSRRYSLRKPARTAAPPGIPNHPQIARRNTKSLLDLPPEVRLSIYRLLLCSHSPITYGICLDCQSIVARKNWKPHNLYPAILETCILINREGTPLLYGENTFTACNQLEAGKEDVIASWPISTTNIERITRLRTSIPSASAPSMGDKVQYAIQQIYRFKNVKHVRISTKIKFLEWGELMRATSTQLTHIRRVVKQRVDFSSHYCLIFQNKEKRDINFKKEHLKTYRDMLRKQADFAERKRVAVKYCEPPAGHDPYWDEGTIFVAVE